MAYCTAAEVKAYIGTAKATDDALIADLIDRAKSAIDTYCGRTFTQRAAETRTFDAVRDVCESVLFVDDDLLSITTLTNGDGTAITSGYYVLLPANVYPKYAIKLKSSYAVGWTYTTDPENAISVKGTWGFTASDTPPDAINHAAVRLTAWYYYQKSAPFETQGMPELGLVTVPPAIPSDIEAILNLFVRDTIGAA